ncbi:CHAT domain-containing protein [Aureisphaera galaxeae]|uniref:CHAT domain-containing protein n=1 Tax=Aureisphaera galaxeae TaxID=1538023 RepID=UPI002350AEBD|nr:CHAT domain-containing protein [Aureisphaera galaxeae]MDC8004679.1 CHAT domain-containing protein [Aureisphaera galaxeae]
MKLVVSIFSIFICFIIPPSFGMTNDSIDVRVNRVLEDANASNHEKLEQVIHLLSKVEGPSELEQSQYYHDIAKVFYRKRDVETAIQSLLLAVDIRRRHKEETPELLKKSLYNLGLFYRKKGSIIESIATYKEILWDGAEDRYASKSYLELGVIYAEMGDFNKALEHFETAERYFSKNQDARNLFTTHLRTSYCYTQMDRQLYAKELLLHLNKCDSINAANDGKVMRDTEALSLHLRRGNLFVELLESTPAESALQNALEVANELDHTLSKAYIHNSLGKLHLDAQKYDEGKAALDRSLSFAEDKRTLAMITNNLGDYHDGKGNTSKAEEAYIKSIALLTGEDSDQLPTAAQLSLVPNKLDALAYLKDISNFYLDHGVKNGRNLPYVKKALESLKLADKVIDMIRQESTEYLSKLFWRSQSSEIYMKGVEVSYLLDEKEEALYFMEKDKVLLLLEDLTKEQAMNVSNIPDSLRFQALDIRRSISSTQEALTSASQKNIKDSLQDTIFTFKKELEAVEERLESNFSGYASLKREIDISGADELRNSFADNGTAIIAFILNSEKGFVYFQTPTETRLEKLEDIPQIHIEVNATLSMMSKPFSNETDFNEFNRLTSSIYNRLFGGIKESIESTTSLLVIPDGILTKLPFEVLQSSIPETIQTPNYLLFSKDVHYGLSLSHLDQNQNIRREAKEGFMGVAPIQYKKEGLPTLTNTQEELHSIQDILGGKVLLREEADKESVLTEISTRNIVHLATHADFDNQQNTWLWFFDERMNHTELYLTKTQADLVVLSACKTMQGEWIEGEGLMSLTRGFLKAGANTVLSSLWNANDKSNRDIMISFYRNLEADQTKASALRNAKIEYLNVHSGVASSPYYWASNVITGNGESLQNMPHKFSLQTLIIIGIAVLLIFFLLFRSKKVSFFG